MIKNICHSFSTLQHSRLFLFAGQGTQEIRMLDSIPEKQRKIGLSLASRLIGIDLEEVVTKDENKMINQTQITQPLLLLSHYLHFQKEKYHQNLSEDDWMIGHSLGQFSALVNANSLQLDEGLKLVHLRGQLMKKYTTTPHGMLVIKFKPEKKEEVFAQIQNNGLEIACINTRTSIIVAGQTQKIHSLQKSVKKYQAAALTLPVSTAFHCRMLEGMQEQFRHILAEINFRPPNCKILRNYDYQPYKSAQDIREGLLKQLTNPVRFQQSVEQVPQTCQIIEVGHKRWISKFAEEVRRDSFMESLI